MSDHPGPYGGPVPSWTPDGTPTPPPPPSSLFVPPMPPYPVPPYPTPLVGPRRAGMAVAGMVSSIVGFVTCFIVVPSLLGAIFGFVGARQVKTSGGALTGVGMARAGWILGLLGTLAGVGFWVAVVADGGLDDLPGRGLQVGTCVDLDDELEGDGGPAPTVSCDAPHDAEVYDIGWLNPTRDRAYPGPAAVTDEAREHCAGQPFTDYVGVPSGESALRIQVLIPPSGDWDGWRGEYACLIVAQEGTLSASAHRSSR